MLYKYSLPVCMIIKKVFFKFCNIGYVFPISPFSEMDGNGKLELARFNLSSILHPAFPGAFYTRKSVGQFLCPFVTAVFNGMMWSGQLHISSQIYNVRLKSRLGALIPVKL